jgi:DNA primase
MEATEEIKTRLDIVDAIEEYLPLKPAGTGSFRGLCPFHHEKTPSFFANRPRQSWHCFGCDEGGDVISFVMKMEGMEFREALELLAQKTGVQLPEYDPQKSTEKKRLHEINDLASRWFRAILLDDKRADAARSYVAKRGLDDLTGDLWRIGYAPNEWQSLTEALKSKGVTEEELLKVGLAAKSERGGVYDRFRNRVMFTICDIHGNIVGFTGRILSDSPSEAKYVNTPETSLYRKSAILFGLDKAKGEIKRQDLAVIVEGNMDVITSHQFGVANVVASSGTALTQEQLTLLKRFTNNLAIAFDADAAGKAATIRGLDIARSLDFSIRIISLPPDAGKDPDDAIRKDKQIWIDAISHAPSILDWLYQQAFKDRDSSKPEDKKRIAYDILPELKRISNAVERDAWIMKLAEDLRVSADAIRDALRSVHVGADRRVSPMRRSGMDGDALDSGTEGGHIGPPLQEKTKKSREQHLTERALAILQLKPELRPLAENIIQGYPLAQDISTELSTYLAILADREFEDQSLAALTKDLQTTVQALRDEYINRERQLLELQMRDAELAGDQARIKELLTQFNNCK